MHRQRYRRIVNTEFDILQYWKMSSATYPILARMARDILAIPASSVASESAFSSGERIINDYRSRLSSEIVEALVCLQDWLRAAGMYYVIQLILEQLLHLFQI